MNNLRDIFQRYEAAVFFDTETTGLDAKSCRIIELAAIRIEKATDGSLIETDRADMFIKLPEGERIPDKIVELTGITDERLAAEGIPEGNAAAAFANMIYSSDRTLLVAHNAQFDLLFVREMLGRFTEFVEEGGDVLDFCDYLDSLTVYKDRRAYPHKLANAIAAYKLEDKVKNSHRAIDDVEALLEVCKAMDNERADLLSYVNVFGYNPKYGVAGDRLPRVTYWPQHFNDYMQSPHYCHPYSAYERGSNENQNKLVRRHAPKGSSFEDMTDERADYIEGWMNDYPRKMFNWHIPEEVFQAEIKALSGAL